MCDQYYCYTPWAWYNVMEARNEAASGGGGGGGGVGWVRG